MKGYYVTEQEDDALYGVSPLAFRIYHLLRSVMDLRTGIVGKVRRISYKMLSESCETHTPRGQGVQITSPTVKEIRVAMDALLRAGMLIREPEPFVFLLPLASTAKVQAFQTGQSEGTTAQPSNPHGYSIYSQTGHENEGKQGAHRCTVYCLSTESAAAVNSSPVDNSAGQIAAAFLAQLSKTLGYPIQHRHDDPRLAEWVESGLTFEALEAAATAAKEARQRDNNPAPLNPGYIAAFLPDPNAWQQSWRGIVSKGQSLGLTQQPGEQAQVFRARVLAASEKEKA